MKRTIPFLLFCALAIPAQAQELPQVEFESLKSIYKACDGGEHLGVFAGWDTTANDVAGWQGVTVVLGTVKTLRLGTNASANDPSISFPNFHEAMFEFGGLGTLQLMGDFGTRLPDDLGLCENLGVVTLYEGSWGSEVFEDLSTLQSLLALQILGNRGDLLVPEGLGQSLTACQTLDFSIREGYHLGLPTDLADMVALENLRISGDLQGSLPDMAASQLKALEIANDTALVPGGWDEFFALLPTGLESLRLSSLGRAESALPQDLPVFAQLQSLEILDCNLTGPIPSSIAQSQNLKKLWLNGSFEGPIPSFIGQLQSLEDLGLSASQFSGQLPETLGNLANLKNLYLDGNNLEGEIPQSMSALTALEWLDLSGNAFTGGLEHLFNGTELFAIDVSDNQLSGTFPDVQNMEISRIYAQNNNFSGDLPIVNVTQWGTSSIDFSNNAFSGAIPSSYFSQKIGGLYLADNQLEGELEDLSLENYNALDLSGNNLSGDISTWRARESYAVSYTGYFLDDNDFYGDLPVAIAGTSQANLTLSGNRVSSIPDFSDSASLDFLSVADNALRFNSLLPNAEFFVTEAYFWPQKPFAVADTAPVAYLGEPFALTAGDDAPGTRFRWFKDGEPLGPESESPALEIAEFGPAHAGLYVCQATHPDMPGLALSSQGIRPQPWTTDASELSAPAVAVWPNPASGWLRVECPGPFEASLLDLAGRQLASQRGSDALTLELSALPAGLYLLRVLHPDGATSLERVALR